MRKIKTKELKRCEDGISYCDPGADFLCNQRSVRTCHYPVSAKTENGTDRTYRRRSVSSEKGRNPDYGRSDLFDIHDYYFPVLRKRLSPDYSGAVSDSGIWYHRISG